MKKIAIFASGSGTNAQNIIEFFNKSGSAKVEIILTNNKKAYVLERAFKFSIKTYIFDKKEFYETDNIVNILQDMHIDLIVLAGFLWLVPFNLLNMFQGKIINVHPALLPKYGGKGMYGNRVHQAVIENHEMYSGITIHYVNERYDEGSIIFQEKCGINLNETPETLALKVHELEYKYLPVIIERILQKSDEVMK